MRDTMSKMDAVIFLWSGHMRVSGCINLSRVARC